VSGVWTMLRLTGRTNMTKEQFIERWRHEWGGMVVDAATNQRTGADLAMALRCLMQKIDKHLGRMYDDLKSPPVPQPNQATK
jgi:hypothetical protein